VLLWSVIDGVIYGIACQIVMRTRTIWEETETVFIVMSFAYVFVLPLCLGVATILYSGPGRVRWPQMVFAPWLTVIACFGAAIVVGWEGSICIAMAAPIYLPLASIGGVAAALFRRHRKSLHAVLLLPLALAPLEEATWELPDDRRQVETFIEIDAPPARVWPEIVRVRPIAEPQSGFFYQMGFPKPVEATLSREGVGGVREAKFERGLVFYETITEWVPERRLRFDIEADPEATPLTTLDPHVVPGGLFFDALEGVYEIVPLPGGRARLELTSTYRLSTHFNFYSGLWGDYLMRDIQENILRVLRTRCEAQPTSEST
jgi:hypothetical protein